MMSWVALLMAVSLTATAVEASMAPGMAMNPDFVNLVNNNLGGQGPWLDNDTVIQYNMLVGDLPESVDLRVRNISTYLPSTNAQGGVDGFNGLNGEFGQINVLSDTFVDLKFEFIDTANNDSLYEIDAFFFTWFDLDFNKNGNRVETVEVEDTYFTFFLTPNTTVLEIPNIRPNFTGFQSTIFGDASDNPSDPENLTELQESKSVTFVYLNTSSFCVRLCTGGPPNEFGRNFLFAGFSSVVFSPPPPSPPPVPIIPGTMAPPPPPGAVIISDPHFIGLNGESFDFDGESGKKYALIVHDDDGLAMIAHFEPAYTTGVSVEGGRIQAFKEKGTWITSIAFRVVNEKAQDATLLVAASTASLPPAEGFELEHGSMHLMASSVEAQELIKVTIVAEEAKSAVKFVSENLEGQIDIVPPPASWGLGANEEDEYTHLNIAVGRLQTSDAEKLQGVLGITANNRYPSNAEPEKYEASQFVDEELTTLLP